MELHDHVLHGRIDSLNNYVAQVMFEVDSDNISFKHALDNYLIVEEAAEFVEKSFYLDGGTVTATGSTEQNLTIGSYSDTQKPSAANILLSEQHAGNMTAKEATLETIAGEKTFINAESGIEAQSVKVVANSELENNGSLKGSVAVEGTLSGSGKFGVVNALNGSSIVIGNSPGAAIYESLTLNAGANMVLSVDGLPPATVATAGWGSGTHSTLMITGADGLSIDPGAELKIAFSSEFLATTAIGAEQTVTLIQGIEVQEDFLTVLDDITTFYYASVDDTLTPLTEASLYSVHEYKWTANKDNKTVTLNFTLAYAGQIPEPATSTLTLLGLAGLLLRRRKIKE